MTRNLKEYMSLRYPVKLEPREDGSYFATNPDLQGCMAQGATADEAVRNLRDSREVWIEARLNGGFSVPEPAAEDEYSGRLQLRMSPRLHAGLSETAANENVSLNQLITGVLSQYLGGAQLKDQLAESLIQMEEKLTSKITRAIEALQPDMRPSEALANIAHHSQPLAGQSAMANAEIAASSLDTIATAVAAASPLNTGFYEALANIAHHSPLLAGQSAMANAEIATAVAASSLDTGYSERLAHIARYNQLLAGQSDVANAEIATAVAASPIVTGFSEASANLDYLFADQVNAANSQIAKAIEALRLDAGLSRAASLAYLKPLFADQVNATTSQIAKAIEASGLGTGFSEELASISSEAPEAAARFAPVQPAPLTRAGTRYVGPRQAPRRRFWSATRLGAREAIA